MSHDPLCMDYGLIDHSTYDCTCDVIAMTREDERANVTAEFMSNHGGRWEYGQGQRDMLAKCIAAVEADNSKCGRLPWEIESMVAALRALQEKP